MTTAKVKRSEFASFLYCGSTAGYNLIGDGVTSAEVGYNPATEETVYIHQDSGTTEVTSYKPSMAIEATAIEGDGVFEYVDSLRKARSLLDSAKTNVVNVWLYESPTGSDYPAEKQDCYIAVDSFGGEGGQAAKINYTIYFAGDPVIGLFNPSTKAWTDA